MLALGRLGSCVSIPIGDWLAKKDELLVLQSRPLVLERLVAQRFELMACLVKSEWQTSLELEEAEARTPG